MQEKLGKQIEIKGVTGEITHFVIEPFVPHKEEFYLSIYAEVREWQYVVVSENIVSLVTYLSQRLHNVLMFSTEGGVEVEDAMDRGKVHELVGTPAKILKMT